MLTIRSKQSRALWSVVLLGLACPVAASQDNVVRHLDSLNVALKGYIQLADIPDVQLTDLCLVGNHAYIGSLAGIVYVVDISDPQLLQKIAWVQMPGPALDIEISGNLAVVGVQAPGVDFGIVVLDISRPKDPRVLAEFSEPGWGGVRDLVLYRERAYLAHARGGPGMTVLDISDPTQPVVTGHWDNNTDFSNAVHDIFIRNDMAFISDGGSGNGGLVILDLDDPDQPLSISSLPVEEGVHGAWVEGHYVYCSQELGGWSMPLHIIDVSDPRKPEAAGVFRAQPPPFSRISGPHKPWAQDGLLYWAYYDAGLRIFDISVPGRPVEIGYHSAPIAWSVQPHSDGLIYATDNSRSGLMALRFRQPSQAIRQVSTRPKSALKGRDRTLFVRAETAPSPGDINGSIIRVSARFFGVENHEESALTDDGNGAFAATLPIPPGLASGRHRLRVQLEDDQGGVYPYDMPFDILPYPGENVTVFDGRTGKGWTAESGNEPTPMAFEKRQAQPLERQFAVRYLPAKSIDPLGYKVLSFSFHPGDVLNSGTSRITVHVNSGPVQIFPDEGEGYGVDLGLREWQEVDIPLEIFGLFAADLSVPIESVLFSGNLQGTAYLADIELVTGTTMHDTAILERRIEAWPRSASLEQNFPNPFNSITSISFVLLSDTQAELAIYNLAGQKVATPVAGARQAGTHAAEWDGRDDGGGELAAGVYLYRLRTGDGRAETRKLVLLR